MSARARGQAQEATARGLAPIRQPRIAGERRTPAATALERRIEREIARECARYGVSRSFVIANACAYAFGIDVHDYQEQGK